MLFKAVTGLLLPINLPAVLLLEVRDGRHDVSPALQKKAIITIITLSSGRWWFNTFGIRLTVY
jgi:hypothetical protein